MCSGPHRPCTTFRSATRPHIARTTILITAATRIVDAIAVADIEAASAAILPDRVLDEPGKVCGEGRVELPRVDPLRDGCSNVGAAAGPVAGRAIQVVRVGPGEDVGPVQQVVHQRVDGNHGPADLDPAAQLLGSAEQQAGQGHGEDLVRDPVNLSHRLDQGRAIRLDRWGPGWAGVAPLSPCPPMHSPWAAENSARVETGPLASRPGLPLLTAPGLSLVAR